MSYCNMIKSAVGYALSYWDIRNYIGYLAAAAAEQHKIAVALNTWFQKATNAQMAVVLLPLNAQLSSNQVP